MSKKELKNLLFNEFKKYDYCEDIINDLRSLNIEKTITDEEYDTILDNYDKWLIEYENIKETDKDE